MSEIILDVWDGAVTPIHALTEAETTAALAADPFAAALARTAEFKGKAGQLLLVPDAQGALARVLFGAGDSWTVLRALPAKLPAGVYRFVQTPDAVKADQAALAFALGSYRFDRYKARDAERPRLLADGADIAEVRQVAHACALVRDMVNTPANDMGPLQIETIAREIAEQHGAAITVIEGQGLLEANYPAIHAVGRAADVARAPRFIEMSWAPQGKDGGDKPLVCIVGKGVVFDTGGLDIKPSAGMRLMKKDMGGAAHALALGRMVMAAKLPVRLSVLVPVVENAISGDAMRPGDVLASRKGLSIEVGNTDAEGRLILADALTRACELEPDLTIDMATLTGAARIALGPQLPPFYTDDEGLAAQIDSAATMESDPLWRMPLWKPYADALDSDVAEIKNDPDGWAQAGSVTAALFLQRFAPPGPWVHLDIFAWNPRARPGFPGGGEAQAIRGLYRMIRERFA
ncbi:MAG: leucyl aminopeptidase family protein [Alphaproteobacteria bacterium]|nr:leucyl aminopeptidase family protein [Alphaproteobacteria bacterium]MBU1516707.1 leucyl aminopeptidase family protein [Alphaproteobacteria bacterium]MBU2095919.1 leucyl aminopeptidase family protein [Alphaproteobacteria bacterium]MBU2153623.1 leucyl aminopeptidase family protein [Alphaproteobacteria bacterium]MBU2307333.1 leucyl aminopeptidase family protein [Alphaproteobacteria bacterium]